MDIVSPDNVFAARDGEGSLVKWWMIKSGDVFLTVVAMEFGTWRWVNVFVILGIEESPVALSCVTSIVVSMDTVRVENVFVTKVGMETCVVFKLVTSGALSMVSKTKIYFRLNFPSITIFAGMCSNGTCLCTNGWNGKHCTLEGCPGNCNGHGTCSMPNYKQRWECLCESGWYGPGCDIRLEQDCDEKVDNDNGMY